MPMELRQDMASSTRRHMERRMMLIWNLLARGLLLCFFEVLQNLNCETSTTQMKQKFTTMLLQMVPWRLQQKRWVVAKRLWIASRHWLKSTWMALTSIFWSLGRAGTYVASGEFSNCQLPTPTTQMYGWLVTYVFHNWPVDFEWEMAKKNHYNALVVDNCSAHQKDVQTTCLILG